MQNQIPIVDINGNIPILNKHSERVLRSVMSGDNPFLVFDCTGYNLITLIVSSPLSNPKMTVQSSNDGIYWSFLQPVALASIPANLSAASGLVGFTNPNATAAYQITKPGKFLRINQTLQMPAYSVVNVLLSNGSATPKQQDLQIPNMHSWSYVCPSGGIVGTSPVGLCVASNYSFITTILTLDLVNASLTDTEVIIRSNITVGGVSPTIVWRTFLKAGSANSFKFTPALSSLKTHLLEVVLSSNATVYINAQGVIASS